MIDVSWHIEEDDREADLTGSPRPLLGTWHYLRNSLRREWRTWVSLAVVGAALGLAVVVLLPPSSKGTVTLLMAHPTNLDGQSAMATDVSLLSTREVANRTVRQLGLDVTPEAFQSTVSAVPVTTEILTITVSAPDDRSAVDRADALTSQYLDFRAAQLRSMSSGVVAGYQKRIAALEDQVATLTREYGQVSEMGPAGQSRATEILTRRTELNAQIIDMQQAIEDARLTADAAIASTHVVDQATAVRRSVKRATVLAVLSGLIAGTAVGVGYVLFRALTSGRVRRREDVALALRAPVRFSVSSSGPPERFLGRLGLRRLFRASWQGDDLAVLVNGLERTVMPRPALAGPGREGVSSPAPPGPGPQREVALAAIGNTRVAAEVLASLAAGLQGRGLSVLAVDLSSSGALVARLPSGRSPGRGRDKRAAHGERGDNESGMEAVVFRPSGVPGLARGPRGSRSTPVTDLAMDDGWRWSWETADVVLILADVNPGVDAESLSSWVGQVVPLVTAGSSSPELLETTAELMRVAGIAVPFAMVVGSDATDESLGLVEAPEVARRGVGSPG